MINYSMQVNYFMAHVDLRNLVFIGNNIEVIY